MTGKRREMISLNGSGVDDPQAKSLLSRIAGGDERNADVSLLDHRRLPRSFALRKASLEKIEVG